MCKQKNLKLTSVRLDPDMLDKVAKFHKDHYYWTKNAIINNILITVFQDFDDKEIYDMVRRSRFKDENVTAAYKINKIPAPEGNTNQD